MAEPSRPSTPATPGSDDESTMFMPTQVNAGVGEDERAPVEPVMAVVEEEEDSWRSKPWLWVAAVVLVLLSVPLLAEVFKGRGLEQRAAAARAAAAQASAAASAAADEPAPALAQPTAGATVAEPQPAREQGVVVIRPQGQPPRSLNDGPRQLVTKCIERGRVVYTQTGECAGSVTAVPIDADKNVVGANDRPARAATGGAKAP